LQSGCVEQGNRCQLLQIADGSSRYAEVAEIGWSDTMNTLQTIKAVLKSCPN